MGKAGMIYREMRFVIDDHFTQVYVAIEATGDAPLGVQGWHHKTFQPGYSILDLMKMWDAGDATFGDPVMWAQQAPA